MEPEEMPSTPPQEICGIIEPSEFERKILRKRKYEKGLENLLQQENVRNGHLEYIKTRKVKTGYCPVFSPTITHTGESEILKYLSRSYAMKYLYDMKIKKEYPSYLRTLGDIEVETKISTLREYKWFTKRELEGIIKESGIWGLYIRVKESTTENWSTKTTFIRTIWLALGKSKIHLK